MDNNTITIQDVADALGISKTTVSRAISGKGRIGEATRKRVLKYIEEHNYRPSSLAKGLAQSRTYNIGWVIPGDSGLKSLPFFQRCMSGVLDVAAAADYDLLISMIYEGNISHLKRVVDNRKLDGLILARTMTDDECIRYLSGTGLPFVVIGSTDEKGVIQVDNDHVKACAELTSILLMKGVDKLALIGCGDGMVVTKSREEGFRRAFELQNKKVDEDLVFITGSEVLDIEVAVEDALIKGAECIVCMDDFICSTALAKFKRDGVKVPEDVMIASFYNSPLLENNQPAITTLRYDPRGLGITACQNLFKCIDGGDVSEKSMLGYEVLLKESTQKL
ncbi:MAG: LacI family DNA-binding transcriptional regulator [Lachnospiraceae bacterium]|nr:LacI family DNA-binding transcriptional regulator [Lachnospiraceae bacterium]